MHLQTHVMSGWCVGNCFNLTARERLFCMLAASVQDMDGIGIVFGQKYYWDWHHIAGHNLTFGIILTAIMVIFSTHRLAAFFIYLGLFHLHLLLDYLGSGELWTIDYLYPFGKLELLFPYAWALFSWQNITAGFLMLSWVVLIAGYKKRTPLEMIMPGLNTQLVAAAGKLLKINKNEN
jgi:hypothetical protein